MKLKALLFILLIIFSGTITAQEDGLMDALKKAGKQYNEKMAEEDAEKGNIPEDNNTELSEKEKKLKKQWEDLMEDLEEETEGMEYFEGKTKSCVHLIVHYLYHYSELEKMIESEANCKMKYDLYGLQVSAIAFSTTIMYCTEYI